MMSEQEKNENRSGENQTSEPTESRHGRCCGHHRRCCGRRPWWARLIVLVVIIGAIFAWHAYGHDRYCGFGHSFSQSSGQREMNPARLREHAESMTSHMLDRVNATDAQRQKALVIARAAADDLQPLIEAHLATRASLYSALTAQTVDPARLEQLRSDALQRADAVSRRLTQEVADMAAVLTPEQRLQLMARWAPQLGV
jgi:Spy/CpxP family protein refolding chaperone